MRHSIKTNIRRVATRVRGVLGKGFSEEELRGSTNSLVSEEQTERTAFAPLVEDPMVGSVLATVLVFADAGGATQRISFEFPLQKARAAGLIRLVMLSEAEFEHDSPVVADHRAALAIEHYRPDHVIVSRFAGKGAAGIVRACRERDQEFLMHLDDNLFQVPETVGKAKFEKYNNSARLNRLRLLCERAGKVYLSTVELEQQIRSLGISSEVISGKIYCAPSIEPAAFTRSESPVIGYMGTSGHADDLEILVPIIRSIMNHNPNVSFETFGSIKMPKLLAKLFPDRVRSEPATNTYKSFLAKLSELGWSCGLAPLRANKFNDCKANTKFVEYTQAGIPCVVSDSLVYRNVVDDEVGVLASTEQEWRDGIIKVLKNQSFAATLVESAQRRVYSDWSMDSLTAQLVEIANLPSKISNPDED